MISLSTSLKYYKRSDIQEAIVQAAQDREVAVLFGEKGFGKRPDTLTYPRDVLEFAKQGATSFHCSEELWNNPMHIVTGMPRRELDELRKGWDLIIDIDCPVLDYSTAAAHIIVQALLHHGISSPQIKFSGNHGFHIGIPNKAFPEQVQEKFTKNLFPEGPRVIAAYLQEFTREALAELLLSRHSIQSICDNIKMPFSELVVNNIFDPYKILKIDTVLISSRHLYRMPYSLNDKSGLASIPVDHTKILEFNKQTAHPDVVKVNGVFLDDSKTKSGEARQLIVQAFDYKPKMENGKAERPKEHYLSDEVVAAVPEQYFPPCMQNMLKPLPDGKKRSLFVLVNFLTSVGWDHDRIEVFLKEWNKKQSEPLRDVLIEGQVRYHKQQRKKVLPPNCFNKAYYMELGFCKPDGFCSRIKNPVNYAIFKQKNAAREQEKESKEKKEHQKKEKQPRKLKKETENTEHNTTSNDSEGTKT